MSEDLDVAFVETLERDLVAAGRRRAARAPVPRARPTVRSVLLAAGLTVVTAGTAAAGTLLVLRGSPIPVPAARDVPPEQTPAAGSARLAEVRAEDPDGGRPAWAVRVARSRTGLVCSTVGQLVDGGFGLVGLDDRFRVLPEGVADGCGRERRAGASLIGARVFDARARAAVRTVVNGVAGPALRTAVVETGDGARRALDVGAGGAFVGALRGYPEDLGVRVTLGFAGGRVERHAFGTAGFVVPDPDGGGAWKAEASGLKGRSLRCTRVLSARPTADAVSTPTVCGRGPGTSFAVRRIVPDGRTGSPDFLRLGLWRDHPPRTVVWGRAGTDVREVRVAAPGVPERPARIVPGGRSLFAVLGPDVPPGQVTVTLVLRDGRRVVRRGDTALVPIPSLTR